MLVYGVAQLGLIRLITSDVVMQGNALTMCEAWTFYGRFLQEPSVCFLDEPSGLQAIWLKFSMAFGKATERVADAYLAGFALAGGHSFVTLDKGFRNFEELDLAMLD